MEDGRQAALEALQHPSGSMARERAILQIRANEYKMRQSGDSTVADAFIEGASSIFDSQH